MPKWCSQFPSISCSCFLSLVANPHSRKERERRPQVVRRSAPDSGVLIRLKAQMAEVRSKMSDVKSQVLEARGAGEPRPGPSGAFSVEEVPSHHADPELSACRKASELDLLGRAAAARSRPCRPGEDCYTDSADNGEHKHRNNFPQTGNPLVICSRDPYVR